MDDAPVSLYCPDCAEMIEYLNVTVTCPDCGGILRVRLDSSALPDTPDELGDPGRSGLDRFASLLGLDSTVSRGIGAGGSTPVECSSLAMATDIETLWIADEGRNPTGSTADREMAFAIAAAASREAERVVLPSTGHAAQSAAAYAGRAGIESLAFVPSRTPFLNKAMANVHGGDLSVVEGRYGDALAAYKSRDENGFPVDPRSPFRRLGAVALAWDLLAGLDWIAPDVIVLPAGHGHRIAGLETGLRAVVDAGLIETMPRLYAAQPEGCAPIVAAYESGAVLEPTAAPDSIVGPLEIPDPALGRCAIEAIKDSDGGAIEVTDDDALAAAVEANATGGVECSATGGVALAGVDALVGGEIDTDESVLIVDPLAVASESDILRSHLMSQGI
ncbi:pyridoxal-phosphate dependent enzyme [Halorhabdus rudnickae]|uniref:pyridoxal-phosphate dependent enzyme n=1 Tax=Halorhabdus rudnickae TaxID=1775544 RepID=UPI0010839456|nr:pyridoxal-phosphate dependent enzyme [Halorhabdus rudnickae]